MSRRPGRTPTPRARLLAGVGALAVAAALLPALDRATGPQGVAAAALPLLVGTDASWTDREHVAAPLVRGPRDCTRAHRYSSRAGSRMLSGTLLGADLGAAAALAGVTTTHAGTPGTTATAAPAGAPVVGPDAHAAPLSVTALGSAVGATTASVVALPAAGQELAVLQQHARAASDGEAAAATGAVTSTGAVRTASGTGSVPDGTLPSPAVLDLARLAPGTAALAGLQLQVGALASTAALDGCLRDELGAQAVRGYGVAGLRLQLASPAVATADQTARAAVDTALGTVAALQQTLAGTLGALGGVASVGITVDRTSVDQLLGARLGEGSEVVVDLRRGIVEVDLARLLSAEGGVNGRAPGTELVVDQALVDTVAARVAGLLEAWTTSLQASLRAALESAAVTIRVRLLGATILSVDAKVGVLLASKDPVLGSLVSTLDTALFGPSGVVATLGSTVRAALPPVTEATSTALSGLRTAVSLVVNDQRQSAGAYDVAALRVRVLTAPAGSLTDLRLATSSVGPVVVLP